MDLQTIKTEKDYEELLEWIDDQFDLNIAPESKEGKAIQTALLLVKQYEDLHHPIPFKNQTSLLRCYLHYVVKLFLK